MASADSLHFLLHHEEGPKWTEAQGFREEMDNPERKGRSREGQGVWGPGRAAMGKEGGTQVAPLSREAPGEVPVLARSLRQPHRWLRDSDRLVGPSRPSLAASWSWKRRGLRGASAWGNSTAETLKFPSNSALLGIF